MVETAAVEPVHRQALRPQQRGHAVGQIRRAGGVVAQAVELVVEATEVVHRLVAWCRQRGGLAGQRVGRQRQHGARSAEGGVDGRAQPHQETPRLAGIERDHRRAMGHEKGGQAGGGIHACSVPRTPVAGARRNRTRRSAGFSGGQGGRRRLASAP